MYVPDIKYTLTAYRAHVDSKVYMYMSAVLATVKNSGKTIWKKIIKVHSEMHIVHVPNTQDSKSIANDYTYICN